MKQSALMTTLNLRLFDGAGAGAGAGAPGAAGAAGAAATGVQDNGAGNQAGQQEAKKGKNAFANVQLGKTAEEVGLGKQQQPLQQQQQKVETQTGVTTDTQDALQAEYDELMKGRFKDLRSKDIENAIKGRFKENGDLKSKAEKADKLDPVLSMLANKYGVDPSNIDALAKAIEEDDSYYEDEAIEKGMTVPQLREMKRLERENVSLKRAQEEAARTQKASEIYQRWRTEEQAAKQIYGNLSLEAESQNPVTGQHFVNLLKSGVSVKAAYEAVHLDEIMSGAMQYTAKTIQEKTVNNILARGQRPAENGATGTQAAQIVKRDPKTWTRAEREEAERRALRGEDVYL